MKVVITGGSGLIGRALTKSLRADDHEVVILSRDPEKVKHMPQGTQVVEWDGRTTEGWLEAAQGAEAIVNLAGAPISNRWTDSYRERVTNSRVNAGKAVLEATHSIKPKAVIQSSAVGYYGPRGDEIVTEDAPRGNDFLAHVCDAWEASTEPIDDMPDVRRAVIRSGIVLSTKGGALVRLLPIFRMFAGGPVGGGKQYMPWIHIGDEVNAIRFLIENDKAEGVFNLAAPEPVTNKQFSQALGRAMSRPAFAPVPGVAVKVLYGEMATIVLDGQRAVPQRLLDMGFEFRFNDPEAALRHLLYSGVEQQTAA